MEKALLGLFIRDNVLFQSRRAVLSKDDFYLPRHQLIFRACSKLVSSGYKCDLLSLGSYLESAKQLEASGGRSYLAELASDCSGSALNLESHIKLLKDMSKLRREKQLAHILLQAVEDEKIEEIKNIKENLINLEADYLVETPKSASDLMPDTKKRFDSPQTGILSPFPTLNDLITGFGDGELITLSGNSGAGKSLLCLQMALEACRQDKRVLYWNLEMSAVQFMPRLLIQHLGITSSQWKYKTFNWHEAVEERMDLLTDLPIKLMFDFATTDTIYSTAYLEKIKHGLDFLIIDYFSLLSDRIAGSELERDKYLIIKLKEIAKKLNIPVFTPLAISKQAVRAKDTPQAEDQLGGIIQVYTADMMLALSRQKDSNNGTIYITKNRTGARGFVDITFDEEHLKFYEQSKVADVPEYYNDL